jgi:hypothetical protein
VTVIFYLLMRRVAGRRLRTSFILALLLAVPAAIFYSSFNWYMFSHIGEGVPMSWHWSPAPKQPLPPPPPAPPRLHRHRECPMSASAWCTRAWKRA